MKKQGYDVKFVTEWVCPEGGGAPIIAMPNIPRQTHLLNPRNLLGRSTWDHMRRACYAQADMTCEICGEKQEPGYCDCHELYDIDYVHGTVKFVRTICLCRKCHRLGIHSGRAITLYKNKNPLMSKEGLLAGAENVFRLVGAYNAGRPEKEKLRVYSTFLEYLKFDELNEPMREMIDKYNIKFYEENTKVMAPWHEWKLIIGEKEYKTPYKSEEDWEKAMEEQSKKDTARIAGKEANERFSGGVYDELTKILEDNNGKEKNE